MDFNNFAAEQFIEINDFNTTPLHNVDIDYKDSDHIQSEFNNIEKLDYDSFDCNPIIVDSNETFMQYQHDILYGNYICVHLEGNCIHIVNENRKYFCVDFNNIDLKYYSLIFNVYKPRKICINSKEFYKRNDVEVNGMYDISLITKIFYSKVITSYSDVYSLFFNSHDDKLHSQLFNLLKLKSSFNLILDRNRLMSLVNSEMKILEIISKAEEKGIPINLENYNNFLTILRENYNQTLVNFNDKFNVSIADFLNDKKSLIDLLHNHNLAESLNIDFLNRINDTEFLGLIAAHKKLLKYENIKFPICSNRLRTTYTTYNSFANIECDYELDSYYIESDDILVSASYENLYYRIFASLTKIDYVINGINENNLIEILSMKTFNKYTGKHHFLIDSLLRGLIQGYNTTDMLHNYFYNELDTYLPLDSIDQLLTNFSSKCSELIDFIESFNSKKLMNKRCIFVNTSNLNRYIKICEADIFKDVLINVNDTILNYNSRNSTKINLIGFINNKLILETNSDNLNVAVDLLNRKFTNVFCKYVPNVKIICDVIASKTLIVSVK